MKNIFVLLCASVILISINACKKSSSTQTLFTGDMLTLGNGTMRTWVKTNDNGTPLSIGFTISSAALNAMPTNKDTMFMLMLPTKSSSGMMGNQMAAPFDHVELDWSFAGDSNTTIFNHPHLDCHFFTMSETNQMGIMMGFDSTMMSSNYMPANCVTDSIIEGNMGEHWWDTTSTIFHGGAFNQTYMYGFYKGNITFIEIMCARSYLATKANCTGNLSASTAVKTAGYYPSTYSVNYDATKDEYTYEIDNLVSR